MNDSLQTLNSKVLFWNTKQTEVHITTANKIQAHKRVVLEVAHFDLGETFYCMDEIVHQSTNK